MENRDFHLRCPLCGNEELFRIEIASMALVYNGPENGMDTSTEVDGDTEWDAKSIAWCKGHDGECEWEGTVSDLESEYDRVRA